MNMVSFVNNVSKEPIRLREPPRRTVLVKVLQLATHAIVKAADFIFYALHRLHIFKLCTSIPIFKVIMSKESRQA